MKFHPPNREFSQAYRKFLYRPMGRLVLLLTTTGRKTGRSHSVGVQYELFDGKYYIGAADGTRADWYRNILKNDEVIVQVSRVVFHARAAVITDFSQITDFLEYRLKKHPLMVHLILRMDGVKGSIDRKKLIVYAGRIGLVTLTPIYSSSG